MKTNASSHRCSTCSSSNDDTGVMAVVLTTAAIAPQKSRRAGTKTEQGEGQIGREKKEGRTYKKLCTFLLLRGPVVFPTLCVRLGNHREPILCRSRRCR